MARLNKTLTRKIEEFAISLMEAAERPITTPGPDGQSMIELPVSLSEKVKVFDAVVKYTQSIARIEEDDEPEDGIAGLAERLRNDTAPRPRIRRNAREEAEDGSDGSDSGGSAAADFSVNGGHA